MKLGNSEILITLSQNLHQYLAKTIPIARLIKDLKNNTDEKIK